ncbi:MAG: rod shape-determining protein RodA [Clostridiales bacterium]|nr:rod shape-determining protein RodA [Clostridiales bacterium]
MKFNKKLIKDFDFGLLINVLLICVEGIIAISSATKAFNGGSMKFFILQIIWIILGLAVMAVIVSIDYNTIKMYYKFIYIANVALLLLLVVLNKVTNGEIGGETNGAVSWFSIGTFGLQPSEFMKISLIIVFAKKIEDFEGNVNNIKNLSILFLYAAIPLGLIAAQPDLGTDMVLAAIIIGMLFMAGLDLRIIFGGLLTGAASIYAIWNYTKLISEEQKGRIVSFLHPELDPLGTNYQPNESKIAVGSGQIFGMGFGNGLQSGGDYVSYAYSDFIFSVIAEDFGFIGSVIVIVVYISLIFKCIGISRIAKDKFGRMLVIGVASMFIFQVFQCIGMAIGIMPITGITLPFISYGGSSMLTNMIAIGLVLNVGMRRHKINF